MEKIKVNMSPNPLDVQTIHASQNDGEARQWEFELHNNGELIDTSDVKEQMVFKSYKGGTEQLLPENGSTPTTSPFLGDIRYPKGLLTDQEFTYRQSPTESDGLAKITDIKGNTLVWNQLAQNGNFESTSGWASNVSGNTLSASSNELTIAINTLGANVGVYNSSALYRRIANHKYLLKLDVYTPHGTTVRFGGDNEIQREILAGWNTVTGIIQNTRTSRTLICYITATAGYGFSAGESFKIRNYQAFDLTQMNLDITDASDFTSLFNLPYYGIDAGSMLSFKGTGLKTGGKNLIDFSTLEIGKNWTKSSAVDRAIIEFAVEENKEYTISFDYSSNVSNAVIVFRTGWNTGQISNLNIGSAKEYTFTAPLNCRVVCVQFNAKVSGFVLSSSDFYGLWNCALADSFATKHLPVLTYFPTGMKRAGNVYDELTESKAITRVGMVDLGSLNYTRTTTQTSGVYRFIGSGLPSDIKLPANNGIVANMSSIYTSETVDRVYNGIAPNMSVSLSAQGTFHIRNDSYTTAEAFTSAMSGVYLYYELATPTETSFTTASLVTENAEIPLSNEDGTLIGKCTEELSAEPGFHDAKIKLSDGDGTCYSNKLQLHVERKPS